MKVKEIIIVEGISDKQFLETFLEADIFTCNGIAIDGFNFDFVNELAIKRGAIILTDPDNPGKFIRSQLSQKICNVKHAFVDKNKSIKHHKVGVAESSKEEVLKALENLVTVDETKAGSLTCYDMMLLNLTGKNSIKRRNIVEEKYHIGQCNNKTLLKMLNLLNVSFEELENLLNDK